MIKSVTVTNYLGDSIKLELTRPELSGFVVTSISGLGAGTANINTTDVSTNDGSVYNSARAQTRNIVLSLQYLFKNTIEEVRHLSYKYFPIKKKVKLRIETDNRNLEIEGYVESNEPDIFSKEESADISIVCPYPFFYSGDGVQTTVFSGVEPMFEFPFSNESLNTNLLIMGELQNKTENVVVYNGDIETGVTITIHAIGEARNITIYNVTTREAMSINTNKIAAYTGYGILSGDDIVICTVKGEKSVILLRGGKTYNILNCMERDTDWFELVKGDNLFAYAAEFGMANLQFKIENRLVYEGV